MDRLYPLHFKPILKEKIWGGERIRTALGKDFYPLKNCGESWEVSGYPGDVSIVSNGPFAGKNLQELLKKFKDALVGTNVYHQYGDFFPLLIKFIDAQDDLSIQVHPDDKLAYRRHQTNGKSEMWYVVAAENNARIITGFKKQVTKDEYLHHLKNKTLSNILNIETAYPGDVFYIPAGRVHAIGPGVLLAEIQQTSDITYRIYDWDRVDANGQKRDLHTDQALDAIDFNYYEHYKTDYSVLTNKTSQIITCKYFTTNILQFDQVLYKNYEELSSFVVYMCMEGSCSIQTNAAEDGTTILKAGDTILIPAFLDQLKLHPYQSTKILEIFVP